MDQPQIIFPDFGLINQFLNFVQLSEFNDKIEIEQTLEKNDKLYEKELKRAGIKEIQPKQEYLQQNLSYIQLQSNSNSKSKIQKNPDPLINHKITKISSPFKIFSQLQPLSPLKSSSPLCIPSEQSSLSSQKVSIQKNCKKNSLDRFSQKEKEEFINSFKHTVNKDLIKKFGISRHILFKIKNELGLVKDLTYLQKQIQNKQKKPRNNMIFNDKSEDVDIRIEIESQEETQLQELQKRENKTKKIKKY